MTTGENQVGSEKIAEAQAIIQALGLPRGQQNKRSALTLLALLDLRPDGSWQDLRRPLMGISLGIMVFCEEHYAVKYAPNTREAFRKKTLHQFVEADLARRNPDDPDRSTNSPDTCYGISPEAFAVIQTYGTGGWETALDHHLSERKTLVARYAQMRNMRMIPVQIAEGTEITLTPGAHSNLIRQVIEGFAPRFAPGSELIYVGDTGDKIGYFQERRLAALGVSVDQHGKMPDVVLYYAARDWLLLVEAVTSHGPVDAKRHGELAELFADATPGLVYVTAFPDRGVMAGYLGAISWETEVWCADSPTHLIHFDGEQFLGPYAG